MNNKSLAISLPITFDDYAWEVEAKGWFNDVLVVVDGKRFHITFYDITRLTQDIEARLSEKVAFVEKNVVVVRNVTRAEMEQAVKFLASSGGFAQLKPEF